MGNISITIGAETVTKEVDDARLQRLCNLFSATLHYTEGATFADGGPPGNDKQKQRATLAGYLTTCSTGHGSEGGRSWQRKRQSHWRTN